MRLQAVSELANAHVLVLEDEPLIAMGIEALLKEDLGCAKVTSVVTVAQAMVALGNESIDLALLDIHLPQGTSFDLAAALEERRIPFVFASGSDGNAIPKRFANVPFASKPFDLHALREQLRQALNGQA